MDKVDQTIITLCKIALVQQDSIENVCEMYRDEGSMELMAVESSSEELVHEIGELIKSMKLSDDTYNNEFVKQIMDKSA